MGADNSLDVGGHRVALVGESNPYGADERWALYCNPKGSAGYNLRIILGMTEDEYLMAFDRTNLCKGDWNLSVARMAAAAIRAPRAVLLGARVASAFEVPFQANKIVMLGSGRSGLMLYHPSGLNRVWNNPDEVRAAREAARRYLEKSP
jgi:hypothetical protein